MTIDFFRSVASLLTVCGVVGLSIATLGGVVVYCGGGAPACLSAAVTFGVVESGVVPGSELSAVTAISTAVERTGPSPLQSFAQLLQFVSAYAIMIGVLVLIGLEFRELHYLKQLVSAHRLTR